MALIRVAILRGGPSAEHDISMQTGTSVLQAISPDEFEVWDVIITRSGEWIMNGRSWFPERLLALVDVVFVALHGSFGEDGGVQKVLDRAGVRYTGSGVYPAALSFNKMFTKDALRESGIKMPPHFPVSAESRQNVHAVSERISDLFGPQYVIKPVSSGSSVGTMMVQNPALLPRALDDALAQFDQVLVEKKIIGKEATCGVVDRFRGEERYALPPVEITPPIKSPFFDYNAKYGGETEEFCPGRFSKDEKNEIERASRLAHDTLGLRQYSRSDFMIAPDGVYFLEINSLPGLTEQSLFLKALDAVGSTYKELIRHLLQDALER